MIRFAALLLLLQAAPAAGLPKWVFPVLLGLGVVFTLFFFWYMFFGGEEEDDEPEDSAGAGADTLAITADGMQDTLLTTAEEFKGTARKSRMIALKESLERSLDSRETGAKLSAQDRMKMPWFLLVGADGSGKKTILANTGLPLPWGPPLEVDSQRKDAGKWWLFDDAVVLEAPAASPGTTAGAQTLPPGQTVADTSVGWNTLLHMLRRERPDSPLNGIIVTISCSDLIGARNSPERMEEQADRIRNFLERTRKFLGVRLPLHVLVTKCDALPGFKSFADALPGTRRHDIFGWANDADPEARFEPGWVDEGFAHLQGELTTLRDEVLAAPEYVRDSVGVFVFDSEFSDLQEPLKAFVARLMTIGERRPSLFFRGFYFTGDALEAGSDPAGDSDVDTTLSERKPRSTTRISAEIAGEAHNLVFLKSLFSDKIFKEAGLARPIARLRLSRDRRVVAAQAAAILIALIGGTGLYTSINGFVRDERVVTAGLKADSDALMRVLSGLAIDLDDLRQGDQLGAASPVNRRQRDAAVVQLVAQMSEVPSMKVRSAFIPSSWFSPLPSEIRQSMMAGIQSLVLPVTRQRLQERAERLLAPRSAGDSLVPDELDISDPRTLTTYLEDVRVLSRNIERYNSLADSTSGSIAELSALLDYLFGEQIGMDSPLARADFEAALRQASAPKITMSTQMTQTVVTRAVRMVDLVAMQAARQLAPPANARAEAAIRPDDDLEALRGLAALVALVDPKTGVLASVSDSAILGVRLARVVEDSIKAAIDRAATTIARDTLSPMDAGSRLRTVIGNLFHYRLMTRSEGRRVVSELRPNERLRWDVGSLELALALQGEFLQAVVTVADAFPGQSPDRMRRALDVQLRARTLDVAASSQRFTPIDANTNLLVETKQAGQNLYDATARLVRLAALLDSMKVGPDGRKLIIAGTRQAENALAMGWSQFERLNTLTPNTTRIASWQGITPLSYPAVGASTVLERDAAILRHAADMRVMADAVTNSMRFLRQTAPPDSVRETKLLTDWEGVVKSVQQYDRGEVNSSLGSLYRFLKENMEMMDLAACTAAASVPDTARPSSDIFTIRRKQFYAAMVSRCGTTGGTDAINAYQRLRTLFQQRLAGRYPFADSTYTIAGESDPRDIRAFVVQLDSFLLVHDVALRSHPTLSQTTRPAAAFIDQMVAVRPFVASFADEDAARPTPAYSLLVSAAAPTDSLPMALLELQVGARQSTVEETPSEWHWRAGDSIRVEITPFDTARSRTLFTTAGSWGALRFARSRPSGMTIRFFTPETKLERPLPAFPATAPDLLGSASRPATPPPAAAPRPQGAPVVPTKAAPASRNTKSKGKRP
jgi:type VI secretion system protein ImpL